MGIKDLLRFLKPYVEPIHIKKYAGKRVGIDAYSWLHKGAYSCSMELCLDMEGDKKLQYLNYCMHRINLLRHHDITPVLVFDGGNIPCKGMTEEERHQKRKCNYDLAMAKFKEGSVNAASELFQRAVSITPSMAHQLIQILKSENIEYVVAPYEADAQLAYLSSLEEEKGGIAAVISEDSDLLAYGCSAIVFKMDRYGQGEEIALDKVFDSASRLPSFRHFDKELFTGMCVLAGCDFLSSVPGIGIGKAHSLVSKYRNLDRVLSVLKLDKGSHMPEDYFKSFKEAVAVFQHARIYDADLKCLKHLKPIPEVLFQSFEEGLNFLGPEIPSSLATAIAEGKLDPCTMKAFKHFPNSGTDRKPKFVTPTPDPFRRQVATDVSTQQSCFTIISSHKNRTKRIAAKKQEPRLEEVYPKAHLEKWENLTEALALEKLAWPLDLKSPSQYITNSTKPLSMVLPDNNPFKKRKHDEVQLENADSVTGQVSVVTEVENMEILTVTPESQKSVNSKLIKKNNALSVTPGSKQSADSEVVEKKYEVLSVTQEYRQSVDCDLVKKKDQKKSAKGIKKLKRNSHHPANKETSILNFFPRV